MSAELNKGGIKKDSVDIVDYRSEIWLALADTISRSGDESLLSSEEDVINYIVTLRLMSKNKKTITQCR